MAKAKLLAVLTALSLLSSCESAEGASSALPDSSYEEPSSSDTQSTPPASLTSYEEPDVEEDYDSLSTGSGMMLDVLINRFLPTDYSFEDTLALHSGTIGSVVSSDSSIFSVAKVEGAASAYSFVTGVAGNAVMSVYNTDGDLAARKIIRVRPFLSSDQLATFLYEDIDIFYGLKLMGTYAMTFISSSPLQAVFTGSDDVDTGLKRTIEFTNPTYRESDSMYHYDLELVEDDSDYESTTVLTEALISSTGDEAMIYYSSSSASDSSNLLAWLVAGNYLDIHPEFGV